MGEYATLNQAAITLHELFSSLMKAGFSEEQAMTLVIAQIKMGTERGRQS